MPRKYNYRTKNTALQQKARMARKKKRYPRKPRIGRAPRRNSIMPSVYKYKRTNQETVNWGVSTIGWDHFPGGDGISRGWAFSLQNVLGHAQFTSLYSEYKLHGVRLQIIPAYNVVTSRDSSQLVMWTSLARSGYQVDSVLELQQIQALRKRIVFRDTKPVDIYMKFNLLSEIYNSTVPPNTDYAITKPKWLSTQEPSTPHYGLNTTFTTVDGSNIVDENYRFKIYYTIYFSMRGVKSATAE